MLARAGVFVMHGKRHCPYLQGKINKDIALKKISQNTRQQTAIMQIGAGNKSCNAI